MWRRAPTTCDLWVGTIYCRLSRTDATFMRSIGLVSKVSNIHLSNCLLWVLISFRCTARPTTNFDDDATSILRSHGHTQTLLEAFKDERKTLWDAYGIIGDVMVHLCIIMHLSNCSFTLAIHYSIPTCGYTQTPIAGPPASSNQRNVQGSPGGLDMRIHRERTWKESCQANSVRHWPTVY